RDYVYIPLGGSRVASARMYANLAFVFLLTGFWHGANWTFLIWGAYHGTLLLIERLLKLRDLPDSYLPMLRRFITLFLVLMGWVIFRSATIEYAWDFSAALLHPQLDSIAGPVRVTLTNEKLIIFAIAFMSVLLPRNF